MDQSPLIRDFFSHPECGIFSGIFLFSISEKGLFCQLLILDSRVLFFEKNTCISAEYLL